MSQVSIIAHCSKSSILSFVIEQLKLSFNEQVINLAIQTEYPNNFIKYVIKGDFDTIYHKILNHPYIQFNQNLSDDIKILVRTITANKILNINETLTIMDGTTYIIFNLKGFMFNANVNAAFNIGRNWNCFKLNSNDVCVVLNLLDANRFLDEFITYDNTEELTGEFKAIKRKLRKMFVHGFDSNTFDIIF